jgi:chromosome segregation ATPase
MGESAEFETLTMLEARLAAALDRIASGLSDVQAAPPAPLEDPGMTSAMMEDAFARADSAEAQSAALQDRVRALETRLEEAQAALNDAETRAAPAPPEVSSDDIAALMQERDMLAQRVQALEAGRKADRDEFNRVLAARDEDITGLQGELQELREAAADAVATPQSDPAPDANPGGNSEMVEIMLVRVRRMRAQRGEARAQRDDALDMLEELKAPTRDIDARLTALRSEIVRLRVANDDLVEQLARLRDSGQVDAAAVYEALFDEIAALRAARASEAAEIERILNDLGPALAEGGANA